MKRIARLHDFLMAGVLVASTTGCVAACYQIHWAGGVLTGFWCLVIIALHPPHL